MRSLVPLLLALPAAGCLRLTHHPEREIACELLDLEGKRLPEAWAVVWREERYCPLGLVFELHGLAMTPEIQSTGKVQLRRLTPANDILVWPSSYVRYVAWGFLILPPSTACEAWTRLFLFGEGCPWGWEFVKGREFPYEAFAAESGWRVLARARTAPADGRGLDWTNAGYAARQIREILDLLERDPDVPRRDLADFAAMLLRNLEAIEAHAPREHPGPEVVRKLQVLTK